MDKKVKHGGGSLMVWGYISWNDPGQLHRIERTLNVKQYCRILKEFLLGSLEDKFTDCETIIFQQDNDPKHTSRLTKA